MGKQVRFYMLSEDEAAFCEYLSTLDGDVGIVPVHFAVPDPPLLGLPDRRPDDWFCFLSRKRDLDDAVVTAAGANWTLDSSKSAVVEWMRSSMRDGTLVGGRLYFQPTLLKDGVVVKKHTAFLDWARALMGWIRRNFEYDPSLEAYVGPAAARWRVRGGLVKSP